MKVGGSRTRKWASNSVELMNNTNREENINGSDSQTNLIIRERFVGVNQNLEADTIIFYFDELVN